MTDAVNQHHGPDNGHGHAPPRPFLRLRKLLRSERSDIVALVVFTVAVALLSLATPIAVEALVNTVAFGVLIWPVIVIAGVLMTCLGLAAAIRAMQVYVVECVQRRLFVRLVADYAHRFPRVRLHALDDRYGPELANRFFDVLNVQKSLAFLLLDGVALVVMAAVGMVVLAFYHPFLLGFDVLLVAMIAFILFVLGWGGIRTALHESHAKYDTAGWLEELLRSPRAFRFAGGQHLALEEADRLASEYVAARREHFQVVWRQTVFSLGLQVVASTALLGLGGYLVINRQLTLGQLVASELIVSLVVASVAKLGKYADTYYDLMAGAEKLGMLTDLPLEREGGEVLADDDRGLEVQVSHVDSISHRVLTVPLDLHVAANERVAVVGLSGSGKTTMFETLCGLREPDHGVVKIDGIDLRRLALQQLRQQVAMVAGSDTFAGTVLENVRVGRPDLTPDDIRAALRVVGLLEPVYALPRGLDTLLKPGGGPLSGSQSLRLTLARALAGRPRLLILDGVLDALDLRDCPDLLTCLFDRSIRWTVMIATHNPVIVGLCDRCISLSDGEEFEAVQPLEQGVRR